MFRLFWKLLPDYLIRIWFGFIPVLFVCHSVPSLTTRIIDMLLKHPQLGRHEIVIFVGSIMLWLTGVSPTAYPHEFDKSAKPQGSRSRNSQSWENSSTNKRYHTQWAVISLYQHYRAALNGFVKEHSLATVKLEIQPKIPSTLVTLWKK